jgi:two-component system chemotaxis response regulator CheY
VDDERAVLNQLSAQLVRRFGETHRVECAESAEEALQLIDEIFAGGDAVELVICDQLMPGMKGDRFLEAVHAAHPEIMKVLLTGQAGLDSAIYAINHAGLHRYVEKPWETEDLNLAIQNLLTQHRLDNELNRSHRRLEQRSRDLHRLHSVGRQVASATEPGEVLEIALQAARTLSGSPAASALAFVGAAAQPLWTGDAVQLPPPESRGAIEASLSRLRAEGRSALPDGCPEGTRAVPLEHGGGLFGWLFLGGDPGSGADADILSILAGLAAAALGRIRLLEERAGTERLSAIGRAISALVHDLRNPMTAIKGTAGMFEEFELPRNRQIECARLIVEECDRIASMIDEILDFSRGERMRLRLSSVSVEDLVGRVEGLVGRSFAAKRVAFRKELAYPGLFLIDVDRMTRAIANIATNALEATGPGGVLTIGSSKADERVEITLTDTGTGIPVDLQARVFEPFFTHGKSRGVGLGMAITRKIVEEHGGRIHFQSEPGQGTRFSVVLPLHSEPPVFQED